MGRFYVTGADSGFGKKAVETLAEAGHEVFAGLFFDKPIFAGVPRVTPVPLNVGDEKSVKDAAAEIARHCDKLDGVLNNAGVMILAPGEFAPLDHFRTQFNVNLLGTVAVTQSVLPLIRAGEGRIVNVASIAGRSGGGMMTTGAYVASKHAVEGWSEVLRREMYMWNVTVHVIEPGVFPATNLYGVLGRSLDQAWDVASPSVQAAYGKEWLDASKEVLIKGLPELGQFNKDPTVVVTAMVHALTDPRPRPRYRPGVDSTYTCALMDQMPEAWSDWLLTNPKIVRSLPAWVTKAVVTPAAAPKGAIVSARARYRSVPWKQWLLLLLALLVLRRLRR